MILLESTQCSECGKQCEVVHSEFGEELCKIEHHPHCSKFVPLD